MSPFVEKSDALALSLHKEPPRFIVFPVLFSHQLLVDAWGCFLKNLSENRGVKCEVVVARDDKF